jgi:hypothetical protein
MMTAGRCQDLLMSGHTQIDGSTIDLARFFSMIEKAPGVPASRAEDTQNKTPTASPR